MNEKIKQVFKTLNYIILIFDIILIMFFIYSLYVPDNPAISILFIYQFEQYSDKYYDDTYITKIVEGCKNSEDVAKCVWDEVPYNYNHKRSNETVIDSLISGLVLTPKEYFTTNDSGICRDNAVMIKTILDRLEIQSEYVIAPKHVYVVAYYKNDTYEFNTWLATTTEVFYK